jgi:hypothetical protein
VLAMFMRLPRTRTHVREHRTRLLLLAAENGRDDVVMTLLGSGAAVGPETDSGDLSISQKYRHTPVEPAAVLEAAVRHCAVSVVAALLHSLDDAGACRYSS